MYTYLNPQAYMPMTEISSVGRENRVNCDYIVFQYQNLDI